MEVGKGARQVMKGPAPLVQHHRGYAVFFKKPTQFVFFKMMDMAKMALGGMDGAGGYAHDQVTPGPGATCVVSSPARSAR